MTKFNPPAPTRLRATRGQGLPPAFRERAGRRAGKILVGVIGILVAGFVLGVFGFLPGVKEPQNGGSPDLPAGQADIPADLAEHIASKQDLIVVTEPKPLSVITSPLTVRGEARGPWYFEADFGLVLTDWDGRIIAQSFAAAVLDPNDPESTWMTIEFVPFEGRIEFENPAFPGAGKDHPEGEQAPYGAGFSRRGTLIFQKANPSGLPEQADALEIPVLFGVVD